MNEEARYKPDVLKEYNGAEGLTVIWEPALCIHVAQCLRSQPTVFDFEARPWINMGGAPAGAIAAAVEGCPTGALRYVRTDGSPGEQPAHPTQVQPRKNGPLFVRGEVEVVDLDGTVLRSLPRAALCRCGHSQNKPFCDLSHRAAGFQS